MSISGIVQNSAPKRSGYRVSMLVIRVPPFDPPSAAMRGGLVSKITRSRNLLEYLPGSDSTAHSRRLECQARRAMRATPETRHVRLEIFPFHNIAQLAQALAVIGKWRD